MSLSMSSSNRSTTVRRPPSVTAAVVLLYLYAVLSGVPPILFLLFGPNLASVVARGAPTFGGHVSQRESALVAGVTVALSLAIMFGFGLLAWRVGRGVASARLATWIIGGLFTLCNFAGVQSLVVVLGQNGTSADVPTAQELGVQAWDLGNAIVQLGSLLAALILLALPATGRYFRQKDVWVPPAGYRGPAPEAEPGVPAPRPAANDRPTIRVEPADPA
jgi:hypothetical protein